MLCFDSTTVYRDMDIGTAKPPAADRAMVPHHLLDLVEAGQDFTLADFLVQAEATLKEIRSRGRQPILVGGTYLYLRSFLEGFRLSEVPPNPEFRAQAEGRPLEELVADLRVADPAALEIVDLANPRRVVRALEVCRNGKLFSEQYRRQPRPEPVRKIGLQAEPTWLKARIGERSRDMFVNGFRKEVKRLCEKGLQRWLLSMRFIGYPEVIEGLELAKDDSELAERVSESTWRLVKKQRTWGRSEAGVDWFDAQRPDLTEHVWQQLQTPIDK